MHGPNDVEIPYYLAWFLFMALCYRTAVHRAAGKYQRSIDVESSDDEELFGQKPKMRGLDHLVAAQISTNPGVKPWDNDGLMMG